MKLIKLDSNQKKLPKFVAFLSENLPKSIHVQVHRDDYGVDYEIHAHGKIGNIYPMSIWTLFKDCIELRRPEFFSDMEDAIRKYEQQSGKEVILKFWQS